MATYNVISATEKDADSPVTVSLLDKLDQNPLAMFEGASGAPKISNSAISSGSIGQDRVSKSRTVFTPAISAGAIASSDCFYIRNGGLVFVHLNIVLTGNVSTVDVTMPFSFKCTDGVFVGHHTPAYGGNQSGTWRTLEAGHITTKTGNKLTFGSSAFEDFPNDAGFGANDYDIPGFSSMRVTGLTLARD